MKSRPNRLIRALLLSGVALGLGLLTVPRVEACSCSSNPTVEGATLQAAAVFEGYLLDTLAPPLRSQVRFQVLRAWKGVKADSIVRVEMWAGSAGCGFDNVSAGTAWIVFANELEGNLMTSLCSRTHRTEDDHLVGDLAALGPPLETGTLAPGALGGAGGSSDDRGACAVGASQPSSGALTVALALASLGVARRRRRT